MTIKSSNAVRYSYKDPASSCHFRILVRCPSKVPAEDVLVFFGATSCGTLKPNTIHGSVAASPAHADCFTRQASYDCGLTTSGAISKPPTYRCDPLRKFCTVLSWTTNEGVTTIMLRMPWRRKYSTAAAIKYVFPAPVAICITNGSNGSNSPVR